MFNGRFNQIRTNLDINDPEKLAGNLSVQGTIITYLDMLAIFGKEVTLLG